ncbi:MAG TPA: serine hydrolase domain-containing protein [Pyrinomonadaceae bacterium]|nr:serine hydrolase domain-containing protein [Pyrinomonadaceae bacterium]
MRLLIFLFVILSWHTAAVAQFEAEKVDSLLRREMRERRIPGVQAAVVKDGRIVLSVAIGTADLQHSIPVNKQTVFPIYSCTKAFTGVAIMQLVEEGKLDLSAPISRYLDDLPEAWKPITVKQLLTHVSGLPNILRLLDPITYGLPNGATEEGLWKKLKALPMGAPVGERFSYNQTNYALLGKIIDKLRAKAFADVFKERQFQPAAMQRTTFGDSRDVIANKTPTYRYVRSLDGEKLNEEKLVIDYAEFPPFRRTASGMNSSAEDLAGSSRCNKAGCSKPKLR